MEPSSVVLPESATALPSSSSLVNVHLSTTDAADPADSTASGPVDLSSHDVDVDVDVDAGGDGDDADDGAHLSPRSSFRSSSVIDGGQRVNGGGEHPSLADHGYYHRRGGDGDRRREDHVDGRLSSDSGREVVSDDNNGGGDDDDDDDDGMGGAEMQFSDSDDDEEDSYAENGLGGRDERHARQPQYHGENDDDDDTDDVNGHSTSHEEDEDHHHSSPHHHHHHHHTHHQQDDADNDIDDDDSRDNRDIDDDEDEDEGEDSGNNHDDGDYNDSSPSHRPSDDEEEEDNSDISPQHHRIRNRSRHHQTQRSASHSSFSSRGGPAGPNPSSSRGTKRKSPIADSDYIRNNPELYGLRRSGRARTQRQVVNTTSDSDNNGDEDDDDDDDDSDDAIPMSSRRKRSNAGRANAANHHAVNGSRATGRRRQDSRGLSRASSETDTNDSDDDDDYAPRRRTAKTKRRRLNRGTVAHDGGSGRDSLEPRHAEVRFSTRRANRVTNYAEDDDEDEFLESEDEGMDATAEWAAPAVDENIPAIDVILNHRLKEGIDPKDQEVDKDDYEFYIKWQGQSHYHATWETMESLQGVRSVRRLENYIRKVLSKAIMFQNEPDLAPEDNEKYRLDCERDAEAIEDYRKVERVIGSRKIDGHTEYYVKWKRLNYDCCTWEDSTLISNIAQNEIDRYLDRCSHPPVSVRAVRPTKFQKVEGTPPYLKNGELKEFQVFGLNFMAYNWTQVRNVVLADEMGLGKTVQTVSFINWLRHVQHQQGPFMVVVPLSTMPSWAETFDNWTPDLNYVVYNGNETARNIIKDYELFDGNIKRAKFHVLLTTYEYVQYDAAFLSQVRWQFIAVDEAHRLKNRQSNLYKKLNEFKTDSRLLITGTPVQNNLGELSALMDFLNPGHIEVDEDMDLSSEAAGVKLAELTKAIAPYMLRRTKSKVETDLPPKSEKIIRVELSDVQLEYYKNILTKNYAALNQGAKGQKQSLLNIMMELKKASNHPYMFPNAEARIMEGKSGREDEIRSLITSSGKMMLLDQLLAKLKRDGHRVLIFSQMVHMLDILADYMDYRGYSFQRLDGTIGPAERRLSIEHFNASDSTDFCFLLSTRAGGLGINLMTADTVILFDSDWNPQADLQAMARAHRIGQTRPVSVYRLVSKDTVEEEVLERARNKLLLEFITIQRGVTDKEATEIKDKMTRAGHHVNEPTSSDDISRILKRRGQRMFEQSGNQKKLEELDIDSVLENAEEHKTEQAEGMEVDGGEEFLRAFQFVDVKVDDLSWDEIIPKEQLAEIKAEEQRKQEEEYLRQEIERSQPRAKRKEPNSIDNRSERRAKRRAREQVMEVDMSDDAAVPPDPSRPLDEKEYRNLVRAYLRYGDFDEHRDELLVEARMVGRDVNVIQEALQEILDKSRALVDEENERLRALEREGKIFTKKERKAILFDHKGARRINAETMLERPHDMKILRQAVQSLANPKSFRIPEATKGTDYSCTWGAREDGMLCVGVVRHGYGAWTQIRDDPDLELSDKFFLEEHRVDKKAERERERAERGKEGGGRSGKTKSPGAVHLVRRIDYLLSVLKDKLSNGTSVQAKKAVENHHRNNRKLAASQKNSPVPRDRDHDSVSRRRSRDSAERSRTPLNSDRHRIPQSKVKSRPRSSLRDDDDFHSRRRSSNNHSHSHSHPHSSHSQDHHHHHHGHKHHAHHENGKNDEDLMVEIFRPARDKLRALSKLNKENMPNKVERANAIRCSLKDVGAFIEETTKRYPSPRGEWLEERLWDYVCKHWPNKDASGKILNTMYKKIAATEKKPSQSSHKDKPTSSPRN
ncbi:chromodomain helicase hrp3 [Ascosphaera apis ARSEF 7405]|uniref:Chromodomain helicase hrp3 n=1 Tax=Ascosphaera apis ARSEF 7405 TaxID=392613 RepID=A0A167V082_9EURO|nr:chromodomain helicase hrp3 [Ascosphaera apis ARSEF 7405]